jgi:hypothetical protein
MLLVNLPSKNILRAIGTAAALLALNLSCESTTDPDPEPVASLQLSTVSASPSSIAANGTATSVVTVVLRDQQGGLFGKSGGVVTLSSTRGSVTAAADQSNGSYTATLTSSTTTGLAVVSASMGGSALADTAGVMFTAGTAASITIANAASNNQSAGVGATVANAPSVKVADANGNGVPNVTVTFTVATGGGSVTGSSQATNEAGTATVGSWTLGSAPGANTLTATAAGVAGSVTFNATAVAAAPQSIAIANAASNNQSAPAGSAVAIPPSVKVSDANGNGVAGVTVAFAVATGGGSVTGASATTNASGVAQVGSWTLGSTAGTNTLTATSGSLSGSPVTFTATGTSGAAGNIAIVSGNGQTATAGSAVATAPSVRVTDANGNTVAGATVTFAVASGGGTITGASATTNASGVATIGSWTLGTVAGPNTLSATSGSLTPVTFTATGVAGAAALISVNAGNNQNATAGTVVAVPPSAKVTDANGNVVSGAGVTFTVASGGGSITGGAATTNASGIATVGSWTLGATAGTNTLTASLNGVAGQSVTFTATGTALAALVVNVTGKLERSQTVTVVVTQDGTTLPASGYTLALVPADGGTVNGDGTVKLLKTGTLTFNASTSTRSGSAAITVAQPPLIVFDLVRNFSRQIWQVAIDGGDLLQLTTIGSDNQHPSRVGSKLVFAGAREGRTFDLFSLNLSTSVETQLTTTATADRDPHLSPNGSRIVYVSNASGLDRAVYSNADGSGTAFVNDISNNTGAIEISPAWSPGSDKVILSSTASGKPDIWVQSTFGTIATKLPAAANTDSVEVNPVWNSAGQIAFHTTRSGVDEIWLTSPSGTSATKVTDGVEPTWLPDGRLVFVRLSGNPRTGSLFWIDPSNLSIVHPIEFGGGDARRPSGVIP